MSNNQKYWSSFASTYDSIVEETGDKSHSLIINPVVERFLGDLNGKTVLDAGCGNGYWTRRLSRTAKKVIGVDFTRELIVKAQERGNPDNVEFMVGNLENLHFADDTFDTSLLSMVLLDTERLQTVMNEITRVTKVGGSIVMSTTHPCFENPPNTYSLKDEKDEKIGRVVSNYFKSGLVEDNKNNYQHFHHTLSDYLNSFAASSLFIEQLEEPNGAEITHSNEIDHHPYFLIIKLRKIQK